VPSIICDIPDQPCDRILGRGLGYYGRPVSFRNLNSLCSIFRRFVRGTFSFVGSVANGVGFLESALSGLRSLAENFTGVPEVLNLRSGRRLSNRVTDLDYAAGGVNDDEYAGADPCGNTIGFANNKPKNITAKKGKVALPKKTAANLKNS